MKSPRPDAFDRSKASAAARRKAHFAQGGSLATWRGRATTYTDKKKESKRMACRQRIHLD